MHTSPDKPTSLLAIIFLVLSVTGCGTEPESEPKCRVTNELSSAIDVRVEAWRGMGEITWRGIWRDISPGSTTEYRDLPDDNAWVTVTMGADPLPLVADFRPVNDQTYTIVVRNTEPPSIQVISP